ncbi:MAG: hypothetical protein LIQ31_04895, partial [Planctomycetes bacterium]|nr:hypothetical protein [Planctomycetota bacterium]
IQKHYNPRTFVSTVSDEEKLRIIDKVHQLFKEGRMEEGDDIHNGIPLTPAIAALALLEPGSTRDQLRKNYNLADADKAFGSDWLEMFEEYNGRF